MLLAAGRGRSSRQATAPRLILPCPRRRLNPKETVATCSASLLCRPASLLHSSRSRLIRLIRVFSQCIQPPLTIIQPRSPPPSFPIPPSPSPSPPPPTLTIVFNNASGLKPTGNYAYRWERQAGRDVGERGSSREGGRKEKERRQGRKEEGK